LRHRRYYWERQVVGAVVVNPDTAAATGELAPAPAPLAPLATPAALAPADRRFVLVTAVVILMVASVIVRTLFVAVKAEAKTKVMADDTAAE